jgi:hypothetical protein
MSIYVLLYSRFKECQINETNSYTNPPYVGELSNSSSGAPRCVIDYSKFITCK